jgi:hypothetical protein
VLPTTFQLIWPNVFKEDFLNWPITNKNCLYMATTGILYRLSSFRGEDFLEIDQPEARIAYGNHVCLQK